MPKKPPKLKVSCGLFCCRSRRYFTSAPFSRIMAGSDKICHAEQYAYNYPLYAIASSWKSIDSWAKFVWIDFRTGYFPLNFCLNTFSITGIWYTSLNMASICTTDSSVKLTRLNRSLNWSSAPIIWFSRGCPWFRQQWPIKTNPPASITLEFAFFHIIHILVFPT